MGKIDFEKFRNIIYDMYYRNEQTFPNFTLLKNAFDVCDLRKDGMIDINEWCKAFASYNGKLDPSPNKVSNGLEFYDRKFKTLNNFKLKSNIEHNRMVLRDWETSGDISKIYKFINKNRKYIKNKINEMNLMINSKKGNCIHPDNLLKVIKELLPNAAMSTTQWKIIVNIGKSKKFESLIDIDEFFRLIEITAKNMDSHPNICLNNQNRTYRVSNSLKHKVFIKTETDNIAHNNIYTSYNSTIPWKKKYKILNDHKNDKENDLQRSEKIIKYKNVFI
jgi:Ca2+-binding EF-hand superfamily protein